MKKPDPLENFVIGVEALARVRALETYLFILAEDHYGIDHKTSEEAVDNLVILGRERLLRWLGRDELAILEMLRGMGIDPAPNGDS